MIEKENIFELLKIQNNVYGNTVLHLIWNKVDVETFQPAINVTTSILKMIVDKDKSKIFELLKLKNNNVDNTNTVLHLICYKVNNKDRSTQAIDVTKYILDNMLQIRKNFLYFNRLIQIERHCCI